MQHLDYELMIWSYQIILIQLLLMVY